MKFLWNNDLKSPVFPALDKDISTDVLIIGGGIAGILCAYRLTERGIPCVIAEADRILNGVTLGTTAKITSQHGLLYDRLLRKKGENLAQLYFGANEKAVLEYEKLSKIYDCEFERRDNYIYSLGSNKKIEAEIKAIEKIGGKAFFTDKTELPFRVSGAVKTTTSASFKPLMLLYSLAKNLKIYENTRITEIRGSVALTEKGNIRAKKIIVATHFPFINKHGSYFMKLYQKRSYVAAFSNAQEIKGMYRDESDSGFSFRQAGKYLLIGSKSERTGKPSSGPSDIKEFAKKYYLNAKEEFFWATQDCIPLDGVPYIGQYSKSTDNLFVLTGFNKWGMTTSMLGADLIADLIEGKENDLTLLYSPSRNMITKQLFINGFEAVSNIARLTERRCPHLGCALKWNKNEHTWDCPCHGSRFSHTGKLLDNPATGDLK